MRYRFDVAVAATALLYAPCLLAVLLFCAAPHRGPTTLTLDVDRSGSQVIGALGTPPKPTRFLLLRGADDCGVRLWRGVGRSPSASASWDEGGADFLVLGGARAFLPMRVIDDADADTPDESMQGAIGLCPLAVRSWGLAPRYGARCSRLAIGEDAGDEEEECERGAEPARADPDACPWCVAGVSSPPNDTAATVSSPELGVAAVFPRCLPCARGRTGVALALGVVTLFGSLCAAAAAGGGRACSAAVVAAACVFVSAAAGAGEPASAGSLAFFGAAVIALGIARLALGSGRMLVDVPLCASFWFASSRWLSNFFARSIVAGGAAGFCAAAATACALESALRRERPWWRWAGWCALAGAVNAGAGWLAGAPMVSAFFGWSAPMRLATFGLLFSVTALPALIAATLRIVASSAPPAAVR